MTRKTAVGVRCEVILYSLSGSTVSADSTTCTSQSLTDWSYRVLPELANVGASKKHPGSKAYVPTFPSSSEEFLLVTALRCRRVSLEECRSHFGLTLARRDRKKLTRVNLSTISV